MKKRGRGYGLNVRVTLTYMTCRQTVKARLTLSFRGKEEKWGEGPQTRIPLLTMYRLLHTKAGDLIEVAVSYLEDLHATCAALAHGVALD